MDSACDFCGNPGHSESKCYFKHPCEKCGGVNHSTDMCAGPCQKCGELGHLTARCWRKLSRKQCYYCKSFYSDFKIDNDRYRIGGNVIYHHDGRDDHNACSNCQYYAEIFTKPWIHTKLVDLGFDDSLTSNSSALEFVYQVDHLTHNDPTGVDPCQVILNPKRESQIFVRYLPWLSIFEDKDFDSDNFLKKDCHKKYLFESDHRGYRCSSCGDHGFVVSIRRLVR